MGRKPKREDLGRRVGGFVRVADFSANDYTPSGALSFSDHIHRRRAIRGWLYGRPRITETIWTGEEHRFAVLILASYTRPGLLRLIKFNEDGPFEEINDVDREYVAELLISVFGASLLMWPRDDTRELIGWPVMEKSIESIDDIP